MMVATLILSPTLCFSQPEIEDLLQHQESIVRVTVELENGSIGTGTGVVIDTQNVATNCHVLANAKGANIAKYGVGYQPISMKADWKHDLCLLKFDPLPFKPVTMRDSSTLKYEEEIFSLSYPNGNISPQPSYGNIKATYPYDGSLVIRSNAAFSLGSSGGAMFDQQFNLIGITTFKSPGPQGFFYSLPVEWIKRLYDSPESTSLATNEIPFWALPSDQRPYFMQVVIPFQNHEWTELKRLSNAWVKKEPATADGWYFLGVSEFESNQDAEAKEHLTKATSMNPRHLEALIVLSSIALKEGNLAELERIRDVVRPLDSTEADDLTDKITKLMASKQS